MTAARVFFCEETGRVRRWLRRYVSSGVEKCAAAPNGYHNARAPIDEVEMPADRTIGDVWPHGDPRWPTACVCGRPFTDDDPWQLTWDMIYRRSDSGEVGIWEDMPVGAVRELSWLRSRTHMIGPDGRAIECKTPGGDWWIDNRASNCTMPDDRVHRCWVRHGRPEDGTLHVDKNGHTCAAGAGSIALPKWHGFLHNGVLSEGG